MEKEIKIIINNDILAKYGDYYFKKHPKRKKFPINSPIPESINKWMILQRMSMNKLKQDWKDFVVWLVDYYGYTNYGIEECNMNLKLYFKTKARHDADNYSPKFINDGLTESGLLKDDSFKYLKKLTIEGFYDKENPRTEIILEMRKSNGEKHI